MAQLVKSKALGRAGAIAANVCMVAAAVMAVGMMALTLGPRLFNYQVFTVLSGSMEPAISTGSMIVLLPARGDEIGVGDIITVLHPEKADTLVTHRVVKVETTATGRSFVTKGDANSTPDSWSVPGTGTGWRYAFGIPNLGYYLAAMQAPLSRLLLVVIPTLLLGGTMLVEIWRPKKAPVAA